MGKLLVYGVEMSPPVRAVLFTLSALSLDYDFKVVDVPKGANLESEFIKINPQHTVPVLDDGGKIIWDSHAINAYLVKKYGENDLLYPKDIHQCAVVDQRLHFDSGILFAPLRNIASAFIGRNITIVPVEGVDALYEGYEFMEVFLQHDYLAGNTMTIADFSAIATLTTSISIAPIDPAVYPKLAAWMDRMSKLPYFEKVNRGAEIINKVFQDNLIVMKRTK